MSTATVRSNFHRSHWIPYLCCVLLSFVLASVAVASPLSIGTLLLPAGVLVLTIPDLPNVEVHPCDELGGVVISPQHSTPIPASMIEVVVRNSANDPIENAAVVVELSGGVTPCPDADLTATTDSDGRAFLTLAGGGCAWNVPAAGVIKANGVTIRSYRDVKSPDFDGGEGDLRVNLPDLVVFANAFLSPSSGCHDYDNDGVTDLPDLIIFSRAFVGANHCP